LHYPESLATLVAQGIITEVLRPLRSGKEAQIYLVVSEGEERVAKIYKEAQNRSFKHRSDYTEGRQTRSSRDARAMSKHTRYGRSKDEEAWKSAEVEAIYKLSAAGVKVPVPYNFIDGVLIMELVKDGEGGPAPRLGEAEISAAEARTIFDQLLAEVVRMLDAGLVHGDLSDFNVLLGARGPVVIDFPQSVDAARNQNARELLIRDVDNLTHFLSRFEPTMKGRPYGQELWQIYERGELRADTPLTGVYKPPERKVDTAALLEDIGELEREEMKRRAGLARGGAGRGRGASGGGGRPAQAAGGQRPAQAHAGGQRPAQAHAGGQRPAQAHAGGQRPAQGHGDQRPAQGRSGDQRPAQGRSGDHRPAQGHGGGQRPAQGRGGDQRHAQGHGGGQRPAQGRGGDHRPAQGRSGDQRPAQGRSGDQRPAQGRSGDQRPPEAQRAQHSQRPQATPAARRAEGATEAPRPGQSRRRRRGAAPETARPEQPRSEEPRHPNRR